MRGRTAWAAAGGAAALVLTTATGAHAEGRGDIRVVKTVVNGGGNVIVGTAKTIRYPIDITIKDNSGVKKLTDVFTFNKTNAYTFATWNDDSSCTKKSATTSVCRATMTIDPAWIPDSDDIDTNRVAGVWRLDATVKANDGDYWISDDIAEYKVKRAAQLTTVIAPEKVAKGAKVTVTGKLSRANWEDLKYHGFTGQQVKLQFRKKGAAHYTTVKTVTTGDAGKLTTNVTVTSAGSWRWYFPGTTTTSLKVSAGDALNLK
ncbi:MULTISPECIES: hypothetical protein [unclassified Streptomyces]|uniref:hypothetical protein n=1 Tax=unclassified Streptomyces TaxID=2593676 RepID=UPI0022536517|nr:MULTISPECIES: hypothetical protein [unclassified Streptomyces]MCX4404613.1 hypothetical protein [Streptomyces sp. NBC_01764]MCX5190844.1 hypothetical protein [Streptomyces sp. NBC_00268]